MVDKTEGIVFHRIRYSDTSLIVRIYTEKFGIQSYIVKGALRKRAPLGSAFFQNLNHLDLVVSHHTGKGLQHIREARIPQPYESIPQEIPKSAMILFLNEVLNKSVKTEEPDIRLFRFIISSIRLLDACTGNLSAFHLVFMLRLSGFLGFHPQNNYSDKARVFDLQSGCFASLAGEISCQVDFPASEYLFNLLTVRMEEFDKVHIPPEIRMELLGKLVDYYRLHIPGFTALKSYPVLHQVLHS
ncbi:MAG: DNA repair protein RecO [Bacteroidales bacterium]|nr:DNA repair protein RecO [Bacteroidales bacterium]